MSRNVRAWWFATFVALVFIAGVGIGVLVRPSLEPAFASVPVAFPGPPSPRAMASMLAQELELTDTQRQQVEAVFQSREARIGPLSEDIRRRIEEERAGIDAAIERILSPEQRPQFRALTARMREGPMFSRGEPRDPGAR